LASGPNFCIYVESAINNANYYTSTFSSVGLGELGWASAGLAPVGLAPVGLATVGLATVGLDAGDLGAGDLGSGDLGCMRRTGVGSDATDRGLIGADGVLSLGAPLCGARLGAFDGEVFGRLGGLLSVGVGVFCASPGFLGSRPAVEDTLLSGCILTANCKQTNKNQRSV